MKECDIERIVALGMAGSEIGLLDIPHIFLPAEMHGRRQRIFERKNIISLTRKLGLVSMPTAYTATEIAAAIKYGADYVKLVPTDQVSEEYEKAIRAPLSDAKLLAVGGVNADNAGKFFEMGFCGIGVGSNLYNKKLTKEKKFDALRVLASKYSRFSKSTD